MDKCHKIDIDTFYRKGSFLNFSEGPKCSSSITSKIDVSDLYNWSKNTNSKFHINFLYILSKALNSRDDYKMEYRWQTKELFCYDKINPCHYVFFKDSEICTPVYSEYNPNYKTFYDSVSYDMEQAKQRKTYKIEKETHPNWFDASFVSWESYEGLHVELPDGYLHFMPIVNWGRYKKELVVSNDNTEIKLMMPLTIRLNHAIADGYLMAKVFDLVRQEIKTLTN